MPHDVLRSVLPEEVGFRPEGLARADALVLEAVGTVCPAAALLVARCGCVVHDRAYGHLDPERRRYPTQPESLFDLASVSKLFTATAFMTLVESERVKLDTPVAAVLAEFGGEHSIGPSEDPQTQRPVPADPAFAGYSVDARQITFWHLLTHTSGLPAWRSLYREGQGGADTVPLPHQVPAERRAQRIAAIYDRYDLAYPPGRRIVYSDLGLILLGEAIARLSGMPLEAYLQSAVLDPLHLAHTTYNPLAHGIPRKRIAPTECCAWRGRRCVGEVHDENAASLGGIAGHAGLFSTAWDVGVLGQTYLGRGSYGQARLLSPETVDEMTRTQVNLDDNPRGLGWLQRSRGGSSSGQWFGPRSYGHTGYTGTSLWVDPERALVVVLLTNRVYYGRDPAGIASLRPRVHDAVVEAMR